jgi:hypothetical protein
MQNLDINIELKKYKDLNKKQKIRHVLQEIKCTKEKIELKIMQIKNNKIPFKNKIKIIKNKFKLLKKLKVLNKIVNIYFRKYTQLLFNNISNLYEQINILDELPIKTRKDKNIYAAILRDTFVRIYKYFFDMSAGNTLSKIIKDLGNVLPISCFCSLLRLLTNTKLFLIAIASF